MPPTAPPTFFAEPPARKAVTPTRETKGGGNTPTVHSRTTFAKSRSLLDKFGDWLTR